MWQPIRINLSNFLSFQKAVAEFKVSSREATVISIHGVNNTADGADSNGSGKSSFIDAIMFAITGATTRNITNADLIKRGADTSEITLTLLNSVTNRVLDIKRVLRSGKTATVEIKLDNQSVATVDTNEANKWILECLGIEKNDLINYFLVNNYSTETFFKLGDAAKKRLINRFINLDTLNVLINSVNKKMTSLGKERTHALLNDIPQKEKEILTLKSMCEVASIKMRHEHENKIAAAKMEWDSFLATINTCQKNADDFDVQIKVLNAKLFEANYEKILSEKETLQKEVASLRKGVSENNDEKVVEKYNLKALEALLDTNGVPCSDCGEKNYVYKEKSYTREDIVFFKETAHKNMVFHEDKILLLEVDIKKKNDTLFSAELRLRECEKTKNTIQVLEDGKAKMLAQKVALAAEALEKEAVYNSLSASKPETAEFQLEVDRTEKQLGECEARLLGLHGDIAAAEIEYEQLKFWSFQLGKDGFETYISNKCLSYIENAINKFLFLFDKNLSIKINGTTTTQSEELRNKIDITVIQNDVETPYAALSHGEHVRLDVCGVLAIQQLINMNAANKINGGGLNMLVLDELFEGLDTTGQNNIVKLLRVVPQLVIYITHLQSENAVAVKWQVIKDEIGSRLQTA